MDPTRDSTYTSSSMRSSAKWRSCFPDAYFHVGGDECNGKEWDAKSSRIQQLHEGARAQRTTLHCRLTSAAKCRRSLRRTRRLWSGWDEVLQPGTPKDVVIQSWRGPQFVGEAVRGGNRALLSAGYYIDLNESAADHYLADPEGEGPITLTAEQAKRILGGEATMWSEFVTPENVDSRIWPRTAAIAERLWSARDLRDVPSMYARLAVISQKLNSYGLQHNTSYAAMLSRMTGEPDPLPLRVFGDVMQPPREYAREQQRHYDAFSPLNRLIDAIPPESDTARQFMDMVNRIVSSRATAEDWEQAQEWLVLWRDNDAQLQTLLPRSSLTQRTGSGFHQPPPGLANRAGRNWLPSRAQKCSRRMENPATRLSYIVCEAAGGLAEHDRARVSRNWCRRPPCRRSRRGNTGRSVPHGERLGTASAQEREKL